MRSRVAKNPIHVPSGVEVKLVGQEITIKGKNGLLRHKINPSVRAQFQDNVIQISLARNDDVGSSALAGTTRALLNNMVNGVTQGFQRKLMLVGVGYRAKVEGKNLNLTLGFSHPVNVPVPEGITVETPSQTEIIIKGADILAVTQLAADIRGLRPVERYKGKGIRYHDEQVVLKEAKKK